MCSSRPTAVARARRKRAGPGWAAARRPRQPARDAVSEPRAATADGRYGIRTVSSAEAMKALADPLRLRVLQLLMMASERSWTVKEIAAELGQPVTKLYHHVKLLEAAELVSDVETRVVSGIVEHRYRANQRGLRFDETMFGSPEDRHDVAEQVSAAIDATRDDLVDYLYRENADPDLVSVARTVARLTPEELAAVDAAVQQVLSDVRAHRDRDRDDRSDLPRTSLLFVMNPVGHDPS